MDICKGAKNRTVRISLHIEKGLVALNHVFTLLGMVWRGNDYLSFCQARVQASRNLTGTAVLSSFDLRYRRTLLLLFGNFPQLS